MHKDGTQRFSLSCAPAGGTAPDPKGLCALVGEHPFMTRPPRSSSICLGGSKLKGTVSIAGVVRGRAVHATVGECDFPQLRVEAYHLWLEGLGLEAPLPGSQNA